MIIRSLRTLAKLSSDELVGVFVDNQNAPHIREAALECWLSLNHAANQTSIARIRAMIDQARQELMIKGLHEHDLSMQTPQDSGTEASTL